MSTEVTVARWSFPLIIVSSIARTSTDRLLRPAEARLGRLAMTADAPSRRRHPAASAGKPAAHWAR
jgi:hypothetical protein